MSDAGWQRLVADDGLFEAWIPPGAALTRAAGTPADELYLSCALASGAGTFSIRRQSLPAPGPAERLALERAARAAVTVEIDQPIVRADGPAHRLRYRATDQRPREIGGATTDGQSQRPARRIEELVDVLFLVGHQAALTVGYRVDHQAPPALAATLARMLERFRLLRAL